MRNFVAFVLAIFLAFAPVRSYAAIGDYGYMDGGVPADGGLGLPLLFLVGGGLEYSQTELKPRAGTSRFKGLGWEAHVGVLYPLLSWFAIYGQGEFGGQSFDNYANTESVRESGDNSHFGGRFGVYLWQIGLGVGLRKNSIEIETYSTTNGLRTLKISGATPYWWLSLWFPIKKRLGLSIEGQYHYGAFDSPAQYDFHQYTGRLALSFLLQ